MDATIFRTKKGHTVTTRAIGEEDLEALLAYVNRLIGEDTYIMRSGKELTRAEESKYLRDALKKIEQRQKIHIVAWIDGALVASAEVRRQDHRKQHVGEIGISIDKAYRGQGIGKELLAVLIEEAKALGLRLLYLHCFAINTPAIALYEKLGFKKSGTIPGMLAYKGEHLDEVIMYLPLV